MKKQSKLDDLLQNTGWLGSVTRLAVVCTAVLGIYWLPIAYAWYSAHFLSHLLVVNEQSHEIEMNIFFTVLGVFALFEIGNIVRLLWIKLRIKR